MKSFTVFAAVLCVAVSAFAQTVLYDQDFTTGSAGAAAVRGGVFDNGWKQVSSDGVAGRILYTAPAPIARGYAEVRFTLNEFGTQYFSSDKNIYFSIYRSSQLAQRAAGGHYAYVRIRKEPDRNYFVEFKAFDKPADETEGETRICCRDNWNNYIGKEAVMRFTWSDAANVALMHPAPSGSGSANATRPYKITGINYVVVGAEGSYNASVYCFKYLSLKVVDLSTTPTIEESSVRPLRVQQPAPALAIGATRPGVSVVLLDGRMQRSVSGATSAVQSQGVYVVLPRQ